MCYACRDVRNIAFVLLQGLCTAGSEITLSIVNFERTKQIRVSEWHSHLLPPFPPLPFSLFPPGPLRFFPFSASSALAYFFVMRHNGGSGGGGDPSVNVVVQPLPRPPGVGGLERLDVVRTHDLLGLLGDFPERKIGGGRKGKICSFSFEERLLRFRLHGNFRRAWAPHDLHQ